MEYPKYVEQLGTLGFLNMVISFGFLEVVGGV
jgi:hypothetical protein